jgi:hypothetical protein
VVILTSPDGATWTDSSPSISRNLYAATYGNGQFMAVGVSGVIVDSTPVFEFGKYNPGVNRYDFPDSVYQLND